MCLRICLDLQGVAWQIRLILGEWVLRNIAPWDVPGVLDAAIGRDRISSIVQLVVDVRNAILEEQRLLRTEGCGKPVHDAQEFFDSIRRQLLQRRRADDARAEMIDGLDWHRQRRRAQLRGRARADRCFEPRRHRSL